jgi:hypothetical protein
MHRIAKAIEPIARGPGSPTERLHAMAFKHAQMLMRDLPSQKVAVQALDRTLLGNTASRHGKTLRQIMKLRDDYEQLFAEVIDQGVRAGEFVELPPRLASKPFMGALNWITVWFSPRRLQDREDIDELATLHADFALRGLRREVAR